LEGKKALGFIKTGHKNLFISQMGGMHQMNARCVLDFYVHETVQRRGLGAELFHCML
jgi:alpha-tubulin N-acetyltransferase 1